MASHGGSKHLKRLVVSRSVQIPRKNSVWFKKSSPGPHSLRESIPLVSLLRDFLRFADTSREARKIIVSGAVLVDGRKVSGTGFPVGLMDVVSVPKTGAFYRVVSSRGGLALREVSKEEGEWKYCKIIGKKVVGKNKMQLCFHDGRTLLVEGKGGEYKLGDSVKLSIPRQAVKEVLTRERNCLCFVCRGKHCGELGKLVELRGRERGGARTAVLDDSDKSHLITLQDYLFVVSEGFSA